MTSSDSTPRADMTSDTSPRKNMTSSQATHRTDVTSSQANMTSSQTTPRTQKTVHRISKTPTGLPGDEGPRRRRQPAKLGKLVDELIVPEHKAALKILRKHRKKQVTPPPEMADTAKMTLYDRILFYRKLKEEKAKEEETNSPKRRPTLDRSDTGFASVDISNITNRRSGTPPRSPSPKPTLTQRYDPLPPVRSTSPQKKQTPSPKTVHRPDDGLNRQSVVPPISPRKRSPSPRKRSPSPRKESRSDYYSKENRQREAVVVVNRSDVREERRDDRRDYDERYDNRESHRRDERRNEEYTSRSEKRRRSPSPRGRSPSPKRRSPSPRKRSPSPRKRSPTPRRESPNRRHDTPPRSEPRSDSRQKRETPKVERAAPVAATPPRTPSANQKSPRAPSANQEPRSKAKERRKPFVYPTSKDLGEMDKMIDNDLNNIIKGKKSADDDDKNKELREKILDPQLQDEMDRYLRDI